MTSCNESRPEPLFARYLTTPHWQHSRGAVHRERLAREAAELACSHEVPATLEEWQAQAAEIRERLVKQLHLEGELPPLEVEEHGEIRCEGYRIRKVSFLGTRMNRITVNLYIPDGDGPFPAMLNLHGHHLTGKIAARVQERAHLLALSGFVALCVDAAGAGERGEGERQWVYHGGVLGAEMMLYGDTLLGQQVRDNRRCIDFLETLSFVDAERIGVTGASGGGNQTMWVAAVDERLKVAVPVVSVGSFEAYVTRCNCICETLPGFLQHAEEWAVLGLIAPRPLLVINALHDQPAFGYEPMSATCRRAEEIYRLYGKRHCCDYRILNSVHGYFPEGQEAMLGWVKHWLQGAPRSTPEALPVYQTVPLESLICFPEGERPATLNYKQFRRERLTIARGTVEGGRQTLAELVGWRSAEPATFSGKREVGGGVQTCYFTSSRQIPIPVNISRSLGGEESEIRILLSPFGKDGAFISEAVRDIQPGGTPVVLCDLPATGELAWETRDLSLSDRRFHDSTRAALWLGYTLAGEWAEVVASLLARLRAEAPGAKIVVEAEAEAAFAALIAQSVQPVANVEIKEVQVPTGLLEETLTSMVWHVPGFLCWGDLCDLRLLAGSSAGSS